MVIVLLRPPSISTAAFTLTNDPETGKMFVEEDSTLRANGFDLGQVYDDAADVGFTLNVKQNRRFGHLCGNAPRGPRRRRALLGLHAGPRQWSSRSKPEVHRSRLQ